MGDDVTAPIPLANYASEDPAPAEVLIEKVGEFQAAIDAKEGEIDDLKEQQHAAKKEQERIRERLAVIGRARRNGKPLFMLKGGELTEEAPETRRPAGPLFDGATTPEPPLPATPAPDAPVEEPSMVPVADAPPAAEPPPAGPFDVEQPCDESVYAEAACPDGRYATIRAIPDRKAWTGRIDGLPFAIEQPSPKVCADLIAREFPGANLLWGWLPTEPGV